MLLNPLPYVLIKALLRVNQGLDHLLVEDIDDGLEKGRIIKISDGDVKESILGGLLSKLIFELELLFLKIGFEKFLKFF